MLACRECGNLVSEDAYMCPNCGAPHPAKEKWDGWGYEFKSPLTIAGLPLVHIAFKFRPNRTPVVAKGVIAIGQFAVGIFTVAQFGIGFVSLVQFGAGVWAVGQFCAAWSLLAQMGVYIHSGRGMAIIKLQELLATMMNSL